VTRPTQYGNASSISNIGELNAKTQGNSRPRSPRLCDHACRPEQTSTHVLRGRSHACLSAVLCSALGSLTVAACFLAAKWAVSHPLAAGETFHDLTRPFNPLIFLAVALAFVGISANLLHKFYPKFIKPIAPSQQELFVWEFLKNQPAVAARGASESTASGKRVVPQKAQPPQDLNDRGAA
jgi:hypothetical protein